MRCLDGHLKPVNDHDLVQVQSEQACDRLPQCGEAGKRQERVKKSDN